MDSSDILIELLAIALFEHTPLASGEPHRLSWTAVEAEERQLYRAMIGRVAKPEGLYADK